MEDFNLLTEKIIGCAIKVHKSLGPGLLESAYQECLHYEFIKSGLHVVKEKALPLVFDNVKLDCGYRIDLILEEKIVIEVKSTHALAGIHLAQVLTYLKLSNNRFGLLLNFNVVKMKDGIRRVINGY